MVRKFKCYHDKCYIGRFYFHSDGNKEFTPDNKENYTVGASNFVKYMPLSNTDDINVFISERVIPPERPDRSVWLSMLDGYNPNDSDEEIFIKNKGYGVNDLFWMEEIK